MVEMSNMKGDPRTLRLFPWSQRLTRGSTAVTTYPQTQWGLSCSYLSPLPFGPGIWMPDTRRLQEHHSILCDQKNFFIFIPWFTLKFSFTEVLKSFSFNFFATASTSSLENRERSSYHVHTLWGIKLMGHSHNFWSAMQYQFIPWLLVCTVKNSL